MREYFKNILLKFKNEINQNKLDPIYNYFAENRWFDDIAKLTEIFLSAGIDILSGVSKIYTNMFYNVQNIPSISIEGNIDRIDEYAFFDSAIKEIHLGKNVKLIGNRAFSSTDHLEEIYIDNPEIRLGYKCFYNCFALKRIIFSGTKEQWIDILAGNELEMFGIEPSVKIIYLEE